MRSYTDYLAARDEYNATEDADFLTSILAKPPDIPTPWRGLNEQLGERDEGIAARQVISISSGNHYYASRILRRLRGYLEKLGFPVPFLQCRRGNTPVKELAAQVNAGIGPRSPVAIVDWFPNVDFDMSPVEEDGSVRSFEDQGMDFFNEVRPAAKMNDGLLVIGACMSREAYSAGATDQACAYPLRGQGLVEERCEYSLVCWPDRDDESRTVAKMIKSPDRATVSELPVFSFE